MGSSEVVVLTEYSRSSFVPVPGTIVPRAPRHEVRFPLVFTTEDGEHVPGLCENLSESGLLATFATAMDIWTRGTVDLSFGAGLLGVPVRVARVDGLRAGFAFQNMGTHHREKIRELMAAARETGFLPDHL